MRATYVGKCIDCHCSVYWNEQEEKLVTTSNLEDHQCSLAEEREEEE